MPDGIVWFRKTIELPAATTATLHLGSIEQIDQTWVNGQSVGGSGWGPWARDYHVGAGLLKPGKNVIAIRVIARGEKHGFQAAPQDISLQLADGARMALNEGWKVRLGTKITPETPGPKSFDQFPNIPTVLFNGMLSPHLAQGIRGAIWYQGESNASRAWQYRTVLPTMIADWRHAFGQGDFPFYIVSLAAFTPHRDQPGEDDWAELREAQAFVARTVPNSGLAMTIDVGDANDIHPTNKKPVGERLALIALAKEYGKSVVYSGPVYRQMKRDGSSIRLSFDHADGGLAVHGDKLGEFSIAGADRKWHWAHARIDGTEIVVSCPEVPEPLAVRYAWQTNPAATLFNGAGLPAVPFRTDDWPAVTAGRK
jgi:sialate O-acetylesterase